MNNKLLFSMALLVSLVSPRAFAAQIVEDAVAPAPAPAIVKADEFIKKYKIKPVSGIRCIDTSSGIGFASSASAEYYFVPNPNMTREKQSLAAFEANLKAKTNLIKFFNGMSIEAKSELERQRSTIDTDYIGLENSRTGVTENSTTAADGLLLGVVTLSFKDVINKEKEYGTITIEVVTTPKTRGEVSSDGTSNAMTASSFTAAMERVEKDLLNKVMPPNGGRIITLEDKSVVWIGFASQYISVKMDGTRRKGARDAATEESVESARENLAKIIKGEKISTDTKRDKSYLALSSEFEKVIDEDGNETLNTFAEGQESSVLLKDRTTTLLSSFSGKLPAGTIPVTFYSEDGHWVSTAVSYTLRSEKLAQAGAEGMDSTVTENLKEAQKNNEEAEVLYEKNSDGSFKRDSKGNLIPKSLGNGDVTDIKDL